VDHGLVDLATVAKFSSSRRTQGPIRRGLAA
jgi:hypothetical protein